MKRISVIESLVALGLALALPAAANGAVIYNEITVIGPGGSILASVSATDAQILANPFEVFYVPGIAVDPAQAGNPGIVVNAGNPIESFGIAIGGPQPLDLAFSGAGTAAILFFATPVADTGAPIDLTPYLDPALRAAGDTAAFIVASGTIIPVVPEPASWATMLAGLGVIGLAMRRRMAATLAPSLPEAVTLYMSCRN